MRYQFREVPINERPRERLINQGPNSLADYELLAIILRTGTKNESVLEVARKLRKNFESMADLNEITFTELIKFNGIGKAKAIEILAAVELGKRAANPLILNTIIQTPKDAYKFLKHRMQYLFQETLIAIFLNIKNEVIADKIISVGTLDRTIIHPRDILKWALKLSCYGFIIAHNHPSGDPMPSEMDKQMTDLIIKSAKTVGVSFIDHIIVGKNKYYSFIEKQIQD
ncbi:MAG: DNA repair protein RadC [Bacilli bacterium]